MIAYWPGSGISTSSACVEETLVTPKYRKELEWPVNRKELVKKLRKHRGKLKSHLDSQRALAINMPPENFKV